MTTRKKAIRAPHVLNEATHYPHPSSFSRGIRVNAGTVDLLFISGTASIDKQGRTLHRGDLTAQAQRTFRNITALLRTEGASWHHVVKTTCYLTDMRHYHLFNTVRTAFYTRHRLSPVPASTCVQAALCRPDLLVEIDAIAVMPVTHAAKKRRR